MYLRIAELYFEKKRHDRKNYIDENPNIYENPSIAFLHFWGLSSVGRAPALQAGGHRFEAGSLHQIQKNDNCLKLNIDFK